MGLHVNWKMADMNTKSIASAGIDRTCGRHRHSRSSALLSMAILLSIAHTAAAQVGAGPIAQPLPAPLPVPQDRAFRGNIGLDVKAIDIAHQVFSVHETLPIQQAGDTVLLYPQWETASHAPTGPIQLPTGPGSPVSEKPGSRA